MKTKIIILSMFLTAGLLAGTSAFAAGPRGGQGQGGHNGAPACDGSGQGARPGCNGTPLRDGSGKAGAPGKGAKDGSGNQADCPNTKG